jgi:flagellum-specific peptidoglycan hydrolase FlgJ
VLHTAAAGETIVDLAARYGATAARLIEANRLEEPYALDAGQRLLVPDGRPLPAAAAASGGAWPAPGTGNRFKQQFIEASAAAAQESQRRTRVPVSVAIAQAIHESDWGTSGLARNANNFFGIKARNGEGSAGVYWMDAWEVFNGQDVIVPEPFRAYNNPGESFVDHGLFFIRNSRYHSAFAYADEPREFARAIAAAGYATDPGYAPKLIRFMDLYNLYQYDKP